MPKQQAQAYQLLPSSASGSSSSLPLHHHVPPGVINHSRKRTKRLVLGACAVVALLVVVGGSALRTGGGEVELAGADAGGLPGTAQEATPSNAVDWSDAEITKGSSAGDETNPTTEEDATDAEVAHDQPDSSSRPDHPSFLLPPEPRLPSATPLPYPAPSTTCLYHLFTLPSLSAFDPLLCPRPSSADSEPLDTVVTFVNGTGDLFLQAYDDTLASQEGNVKPAKRHYSNLGELRYSLRSANRGLVGDRAGRGTVHGVGSDFASESGDERERLGQIPHWLDWSMVSRPWDPSSSSSAIDNTIHRPISWTFHSEIFQGSPEWKTGALPTFNSFAIESQLHNVPELSSTFVSMNDDFFIIRSMTASDFHTHLLGPVLKVQGDLKVTGKKTARVGDEGEWAALDWAAYVLGLRHPSVNKGIEYLTHLPKTLTVPHLHELSLTFKDALLASSSRRFREQKTSGPDLEIAFLATHYIRQRHREALLYSYIVARSGGIWGARERAELLSLGVDGWKGKIGDGLAERTGLRDQGVVDFLKAAGEEEMLATSISFSSFSGVPVPPFPSPLAKPLDLASCLGPWWTSDDGEAEVDAVSIFRRLAFEDYNSGDLLLTAILNLTPEPGLTTLLPRPDSFFQPPPSSSNSSSSDAKPSVYDVPHLPLKPTWEEADFTLESVLPDWSGLPDEGVDLLDWTLRLLGRYRYTMGSTPSHFTSIRSTASISQLTNNMNGRPDLALLAVNDDIPAYLKESGRTKISQQLKGWGEGRWPGREAWEREG